MYKATKLLSSSSFPTQGDLRLTFLGMLAFLQQHRQQSNQHAIIDAIYNKLEIYWNQHLSNSSSISAILDPHYKTTTFNNSVERNDCINHLQSLFSLYMTNSYTIPNRTKKITSLFEQRKAINSFTTKIALTTDIWSSNYNNTAFLGITMHYINNNWEIKKCLLDLFL